MEYTICNFVLLYVCCVHLTRSLLCIPHYHHHQRSTHGACLFFVLMVEKVDTKSMQVLYARRLVQEPFYNKTSVRHDPQLVSGYAALYAYAV